MPQNPRSSKPCIWIKGFLYFTGERDLFARFRDWDGLWRLNFSFVQKYGDTRLQVHPFLIRDPGEGFTKLQLQF